MPGSWSDFLKLRSGPAPPPSSEAGAVRVYADSDGALRSVQSDGTDAAVGGGALPAGGSTGEVLTKASDSDGDADWEAPSGGSMPVLLASRTLTNAEILALPSTRIELVAAPGAGKMVAPLGAWLFAKKPTPYTGTDAAHLFIGTLTDEYPMLTEIDNAGPSQVNGLLGGTRSSDFAWMGLEAVPRNTEGSVGSYTKAVSEDGGPLTLLENEPLVVGIYGVSDLGGGEPANALVVSVFYGILDLPT